MFIPTTREELKKLKWHRPDIILVTGDSYIDSPFIGVAIIGKVLIDAGFKVAIIAQPDLSSNKDITRLGNPRLYWGVTAGCMDSMVCNYTALKKRRKNDDFTPGGSNDKRPDRATIKYCNLIRQHFKETAPIVIGGVEASLRRVTHYDFWANKLRRSILFNAKADFLSYGMGERSMVELAHALKDNLPTENIRGLCYPSKEVPSDALILPSFDECVKDKTAFIDMFRTFYQNNDPKSAKRLAQKQDARWLIQNPPPEYLSSEELNHVHELDYELAQHPYYAKDGDVKALETIKYSIPVQRGCYGECNFCAIAIHQGRTVRSRTQESIIDEAKSFEKVDGYKGIIHDLGGPTANMFGYECQLKLEKGACQNKRCLFPKKCPSLKVDHSSQIELLQSIRKLPSVKKVFIASGIRYDLILSDTDCGFAYLKEVVEHHISGQMKVAPEHVTPNVLRLMGKPGQKELVEFKKMFDKLNAETGKKQFMTYYLIAAHPGCSDGDMQELKTFTSKTLKINPEQVQIFTPTPSTWASVMYYTETDPFSGEKIYVEKDPHRKQKQKNVVTPSANRHNKPKHKRGSSQNKQQRNSQKRKRR